jgi:hypothetical protein
MGSLYLTDLADIVRKGQPHITSVIEVDGWQRRARGSGGYNGRAKGVSHHHDAGHPNSDGWPSVNYETFIASAKPVTNLHLDRKGNVWVCAAGATNTIGLGGPMGDFALNDGNAWQIGIEAGNNGVGEVWPDVQVRAYVELSARLWIGYSERFGWTFPLNPNQFFDHRRWTSRKIDRKGEAGCTIDGVRYQFATGYNYWDTTLYLKAVEYRILQILFPPTPTPVTEADVYPAGSKDIMYPIDYGIAGQDPWWTEMAITPKGLQWSGGPTAQSQKIREIFVAVPMPRAPRLKNDADVIALMEAIGTFGPLPSTFEGNPGLKAAWAANLNLGR